MNTPNEVKKIVKEKYSKIALQDKDLNAASCCGATSTADEVYNIMTDDYSKVEGYEADADLGLGCGLPTQFAQIQKGDTVIDLGSGAGNDCFVARHEAGESGKVIGIDFSEAMIKKSCENAERRGFNNVEFRYGDIEEIPVSDNVADVIVSNCVLNLVPDKANVFAEMFRILKPGGHFSISDIVLVGELPEALREDAEMYAGCIAGAIQKEEYLQLIKDKGFTNVELQKEKSIQIPDSILRRYLSAEAVDAYKSGNTGIFSITVYGDKPGIQPVKASNEVQEKECCPPNSGCC